ncbi:hypothetical protein Tco_0985188 [Tanacetum coccineum]
MREAHDTSGIGANNGGKFVDALQSLLESSTLPVEVGVTASATAPFVTSPVTPDSISGTGLGTRHPTERFVISSDSSHDLNVNAADDEVTYVIRDSASPSVAEVDVAGPSQPVGTELSAGSFYVSQDMDPETLWQVYIPKWNVINNFVLDDPDICRGMIDHLAPPRFFSQLRGMDYEQLLAEFNVGTARQVCFSAEIRMRLEHELRGRQRFEGKCAMPKAIRLCGQIANVEATEAARVNKLKYLKERNAALEGRDLSNLQLSCNELSVKASSLEFEKDKPIDQVEAMQDEQLKVLSIHVAAIDSGLMEMALYMDEEFYPRYLTTIAGQRWILIRGLKLAIMKCLQSPEYLTALGEVIGLAKNKGMQDGPAAGIDHGKARRSLVDVFTYNPSAEADYVAAINALRVVDFPLLAQLEPQKDARMADIMDLLRLEEDQVVIRETSLSFSLDVDHNRIQRIRADVAACRLSFIDAMVPLIKPLSVKSLTGEASTSGVPVMATTTTLSTTFFQRIRGDVAACRLSLMDVLVPLIKPLSVKSLTGEASTSGVPVMATTTALSTTFIQASTSLPW